ncbi:MAG: hypothetical protein M1339_03420, partial [Bacteroidetes bacterium]|nr:hypothetical protein [Bacteroidota bacterium]
MKKNMELLAETKKEKNSTTRIEVNYIRYLGNLDDMILMKNFADSLGFAFRQTIAALFPLEKLVIYLSDSPEKEEIVRRNHELLSILAFPYDELREISTLFKRFPCDYKDTQMAFDPQGNVQLCCLIYDPRRFTICNYLSTSFADIQSLKAAHTFCHQCMSNGIHTLGLKFGPHLKPAVMKKFADHYKKSGVDFNMISAGDLSVKLVQWQRFLKECLERSSWLQK